MSTSQWWREQFGVIGVSIVRKNERQLELGIVPITCHEACMFLGSDATDARKFEL